MKIVLLHKYTIEMKDECNYHYPSLNRCYIKVSLLIIKTKTEYITDNLYQLCAAQ